MNDHLSQSIFTVEVDRKPVLAFQSRKHSEAEVVLADTQLRSQLELLKSAGKPLCDNYSIFRIRMARADERQLFYKRNASILTTGGKLAVILVELDAAPS